MDEMFMESAAGQCVMHQYFSSRQSFVSCANNSATKRDPRDQTAIAPFMHERLCKHTSVNASTNYTQLNGFSVSATI
jgi:hypothetical protein